MARAALVAAVLLLVAAAPAAASPSPRQAAFALVASLHPAKVRNRGCTFARSRVVGRAGRLWLAVGSTCYPHEAVRTRVRLFRWAGGKWKLDGTVVGPLGPSMWISSARLTGSDDPDFAIQGCGAADTNCLSVVSRVGGRWHAVPFEYGYRTALSVNGVAFGHLVQTAVDACSCAGGPSTWTLERYTRGVFRPADAPGRPTACTRSGLASVADPAQVQLIHFDRVTCAAGWALAVGSGAGFAGPAVGLFEHVGSRKWRLITLDNGAALPAAPAIYDLPVSLLVRLLSRFGNTLAPQVGAARLVARLELRERFFWPQQDGMVRERGAWWLLAELPLRRHRRGYGSHPTGAVVYRWDGHRWAVRGRIARLPEALDIGAYGGWFVSVPLPAGAVGFRIAGSLSHPRAVITNAGGRWHVERR